MVDEERKLCLLCARRSACQGKYCMPGGQAWDCPEYRRETVSASAGLGKRNLLLVGPPGSERTRLIEAIADRICVGLDGYYTRTVKDGLFRSHQELVLLSNGASRVLPDASSETVDRHLIPTLERALRAESPGLLVLDEVGALHCASALFRRLVVDCFTSDKSVLATMSLGGREDRFLLSLESRADVTVLPLRDEHREDSIDLVASLLSGDRAPQCA